MFRDNESVVKSSTHLHAKLQKRYNILSFHQVRKAIASKFVSFQFINGKTFSTNTGVMELFINY